MPRNLDPMTTIAVTFKTKTELAVNALQEAIYRGELHAGDRVTINQLAKRLEMSVTPVREAIRVLESTGLVSSEPHRRGFIVNEVTIEDIEEIALIRAPMEALATRLAVPKLTEQDIARLEALQQAMVRAVEADDDELLTQTNADWHLSLYAVAQTRHVLRYIVQLFKPFYGQGFWWQDSREMTLREHDEILEALRSRNAERAGRLMEEHVQRSHRSIISYLREQAPDGPLLVTPAAQYCARIGNRKVHHSRRR